MTEFNIVIIAGALLFALAFALTKWESAEMAHHGLQQCVIVSEHSVNTAWQRECGK